MFLLLDRDLSKKIVWPSCAFWLSVEAAGADAPDDGLDASLLDELPPPQAASIAETEQIRARDSVRLGGIVFAGKSVSERPRSRTRRGGRENVRDVQQKCRVTRKAYPAYSCDGFRRGK